MPASTTSSLSKRELLALLDTANELTATDTLQQALVTILNLAGGLLKASAGSVILYDAQRNDLYFAAATGPVADTLRDRHIPIEKTKAGQVFATGTPIVENHLEDHYKEVDRQTEYTTRSMICVPLSHRQTTYGVMQLLNKAGGKEPYDERDIELASRFGTQATIAIHNARLFEQMLATSGLYSRPEVRQDLIRQMTASGRATIRPSWGEGISVTDAAGYVISNLNVVGAGDWASGTLAASRRKWSDHQMLMLQPPGHGSTYRYALPRGPPRNRPEPAPPPERRMRPDHNRCMRAHSLRDHPPHGLLRFT